jgi:hypothetical protein
MADTPAVDSVQKMTSAVAKSSLVASLGSIDFIDSIHLPWISVKDAGALLYINNQYKSDISTKIKELFDFNRRDPSTE